MTTLLRLALPLAVCALAGAAAWLADSLARRRRAGGGSGDYWSRVARRSCFFLGLPLLLSGALERLLPQVWQAGWHLLFDRTGVFGWAPGRCYPLALLLPFATWGALLAYGLAEAPRQGETGRWLAGSLGAGGSRAWVLLCALPLAAILAVTVARLGGGLDAYPAAIWGALAVVTLSLAGVAASAGAAAGAPTPAAMRSAAAATLAPWPQALAARGLQLRRLASWPESAPTRAVRPAAAGHAERLRLMGAGPVAPELIEAIHGLLSPAPTGSDGGNHRLVLLPDDCGEQEAVALAATILDQRFHATTLVVTAGRAAELAARLRRWTGDAASVAAISDGGGSGVLAGSAALPTEALIWVIDAQWLSDRLLARLKDPLLAKRFGLVVWWHLEDYSGVLAANLWAISRRLHRLLQASGRHDVRTLALVRSAPHGSAQIAAFVRRLLPHPFPSSAETHVEQRFPRSLHLHLLESHRGLFAHDQGIPPRLRLLPLVAAKVSVEAGWPTCVEVPDDVAEIESSAFLQLPAGAAPLGDRLLAGSAESGARIRQIRPGELLSLPEVIGQGGRAALAGLPHHVGVLAPANPYAAYLLSRLAAAPSLGASRRLVSSEAHPAVIRRHLMLALSELPATRSGLLNDFLWQEEVIRETLDEIAAEGKLTRREVRFLAGGALRRDHEYTSQRPPSGEQRPLDTVGAELVDVRDPAAGYDESGVRMRVDPERLTIQAYPHRVFLSHGRRYRIREWGRIEQALATGWLACEPEEVYATTWRLRSSQVFGIVPAGAPVGVGRSGRLLSRIAVALSYEEWVTGALRQVPDLTTGEAPAPETLRLARPIAQSFATRGLVLRFPQPEAALALGSLCQALRHVLPVHLGIDEDALELVPLAGDEILGQPTFGLAVVDLYPGGVGLVDAIGDDGAWLLALLGWARDWLAACPCQSDAGCAACLRSPASLAANSFQAPLRGAALALLRQIV